MKTSPRFRDGNALLTTLMLLLVAAALVGVSLNVASNTAQLSGRSRDVVKAEAAAEGALEYAYAVWLKRIKGAPITTDEANDALEPPEFDGVSYASTGTKLRIDALDEYGVPMTSGTIPPRVTGRVPGYEGWSGQTFTYVAQARMQVDDDTVIGVRRLFQYTEVPLFQSMFFFQDDLELYRPAAMVLNGLVHSNGKVYFATDPDSGEVTVGDNVTFTSGYTEAEPPSAKYWTAGYKKNWTPSGPTWATGKASQLHNVPAIQPMGSDPEQVFDTTDDNPNNDGFRELIEPADPDHDDPEAIAPRRLITKAGIVITISGSNASTITVTTQNGTVLSADGITEIRSAISKINSRVVITTSTNRRGTVVSSTSAVGVYDKRESSYVDIVDLDVSKLKEAIESQTSNFNNVLYVADMTASSETDSEPKTIRLKNGSNLPDDGLTIASENPVYIWGDYNTGATGTSVPSNASGASSSSRPTKSGYDRKPAAVIADAVMFLSNNWDDDNSDSSLSSRTASNTTYNTAIISGFMPSTSGNYSGGANNFPRFLENWGSKRCTYYGSMVELFPSKIFTGEWDTGDIYSPPTRWWNFDKSFLNHPPPGSVDAIVLSRGPWSRF